MRAEMDRLAQQLPEYETAQAIYGVGKNTSHQLIAEIGDVRCFPRRSSIVSFARITSTVENSGKHISKNNPTTKRSLPHLRKTLYQIICTYLKAAPADEQMHQFLDKKRAESKSHFINMTVAQNKFLHIYYAHVKECLLVTDIVGTVENQQWFPALQAGKVKTDLPLFNCVGYTQELSMS